MTYEEMMTVAMSVLAAHQWEVEEAAGEIEEILEVEHEMAAELAAAAMEEWSDIYAE